MTDIWDKYNSSVARQQQLKAELTEITVACKEDHQKEPITECEPCYEKFLACWRSRYFGIRQADWFTGRQPFLKELDEMFSQAKAHKVNPQKIAELANEEKKKWYIDFLKGSIAPVIPGGAAEKDAFQRELETKGHSVDELMEFVTEKLGGQDAQPRPSDLNAFLVRIAPPASRRSRVDTYRDAFFTNGDGETNEVTTKAFRKYLRMAEDEIIFEQIIVALSKDEDAQDATDRKRYAEAEDRLEVLMRGKSAWEKKKKQKADQANKRAALEAAAEKRRLQLQLLRELDNNLPACFTCEKNVDREDCGFCVFCRLLNGLWEVGNVTIYCNQECHEQGFSSHERDHACAGAQWCLWYEGDNDGDRHMERPKDDTVVFCAECVRVHKLPATYCSIKCLANNFQRHREQVHIPRRKQLESPVDDSDNLEFRDENRSQRELSEERGKVGGQGSNVMDRAKDLTQQTQSLELHDLNIIEPTEAGHEKPQQTVERLTHSGGRTQHVRNTDYRDPKANQQNIPDQVEKVKSNQQSNPLRQVADDQARAVEKEPMKNGEAEKSNAKLQRTAQEQVRAEEEDQQKKEHHQKQEGEKKQSDDLQGKHGKLEEAGESKQQQADKSHAEEQERALGNQPGEKTDTTRQGLAAGRNSSKEKESTGAEKQGKAEGLGQEVSHEQGQDDGARQEVAREARTGESVNNGGQAGTEKPEQVANRIKEPVAEDVEMGGKNERIATQDPVKEHVDNGELARLKPQDRNGDHVQDQIKGKETAGDDVEMGGTGEEVKEKIPAAGLASAREHEHGQTTDPVAEDVEMGGTNEQAGLQNPLGERDESREDKHDQSGKQATKDAEKRDTQAAEREPLEDQAGSGENPSTDDQARTAEKAGAGPTSADKRSVATEQASLDGESKKEDLGREPASTRHRPDGHEEASPKERSGSFEPSKERDQATAKGKGKEKATVDDKKQEQDTRGAGGWAHGKKEYSAKNLDQVLITIPAALKEWEEKFGVPFGTTIVD